MANPTIDDKPKRAPEDFGGIEGPLFAPPPGVKTTGSGAGTQLEENWGLGIGPRKKTGKPPKFPGESDIQYNARLQIGGWVKPNAITPETFADPTVTPVPPVVKPQQDSSTEVKAKAVDSGDKRSVGTAGYYVTNPLTGEPMQIPGAQTPFNTMNQDPYLAKAKAKELLPTLLPNMLAPFILGHAQEGGALPGTGKTIEELLTNVVPASYKNQMSYHQQLLYAYGIILKDPDVLAFSSYAIGPYQGTAGIKTLIGKLDTIEKDFVKSLEKTMIMSSYDQAAWASSGTTTPSTPTVNGEKVITDPKDAVDDGVPYVSMSTLWSANLFGKKLKSNYVTDEQTGKLRLATLKTDSTTGIEEALDEIYKYGGAPNAAKVIDVITKKAYGNDLDPGTLAYMKDYHTKNLSDAIAILGSGQYVGLEDSSKYDQVLQLLQADATRAGEKDLKNSPLFKSLLYNYQSSLGSADSRAVWEYIKPNMIGADSIFPNVRYGDVASDVLAQKDLAELTSIYKQRYAEDIVKGRTSATVPFNTWLTTLSKDDKLGMQKAVANILKNVDVKNNAERTGFVQTMARTAGANLDPAEIDDVVSDVKKSEAYNKLLTQWANDNKYIGSFGDYVQNNPKALNELSKLIQSYSEKVSTAKYVKDRNTEAVNRAAKVAKGHGSMRVDLIKNMAATTKIPENEIIRLLPKINNEIATLMASLDVTYGNSQARTTKEFLASSPSALSMITNTLVAANDRIQDSVRPLDPKVKESYRGILNKNLAEMEGLHDLSVLEKLTWPRDVAIAGYEVYRKAQGEKLEPSLDFNAWLNSIGSGVLDSIRNAAMGLQNEKDKLALYASAASIPRPSTPDITPAGKAHFVKPKKGNR